MNTLLLWDIENISFKTLKNLFLNKKPKKNEKNIKYLLKNKNIDKIIVRNNKFNPLKENDENFLKNNHWNIFLVKPGDNSADYKIQDILKNNLNKYDSFVLITNDYGFHDIITEITKLKKEITLISEKDRNKKLINYCNKNNSFDKLYLKIEYII